MVLTECRCKLITELIDILNFWFLVEVRHTFDLMKFYDQTESQIIYVTTHDAVVAARNALRTGNVPLTSFLFFLRMSFISI